ncbi:MAG: hypothetical protein LBC94_03880 [Desulfovibrio sp.]|jgi:hypothetical protein|nr:hypothetical protein [Desulfovibrio sp.]
MKYQQPYGISDANAGYIDGNPALGIEGSAVPARAIEHPMRELVHLIAQAGITPDAADLTQVYEAVQRLIQAAMPPAPEKYDVGQYYWFEDEIQRPGLKPLLGGVIEGVSQTYPRMVDYLLSAAGQQRCVTQAEWDALHVATWATLADGTQVGWEGIGGVNRFVLDLAADTLRLPDLAGMVPEQIGFDSLGVGGAHGDAIRQIEGVVRAGYLNNGRYTAHQSISGALEAVTGGACRFVNDGSTTNSSGPTDIKLNAALAVPTAAKNQPRAWGALACVYLGAPR